MENSRSQSSSIKNIIGRSFIISSFFMLAVALIGSIYFNSSGLQILQKKNLQREQELLSDFLVPAITIADATEIRRILSQASDVNERFVVIDNSGNILMPNYDDFSLIKSTYLKKSALPQCNAVKTGYQIVNGDKLWINCSSLVVDSVDNKRTAGILISFSPYPTLWFSPLVFYFFGIAVISLLLNTFWLRRVLHKKLLNPLTALGSRITDVASSPFDCAGRLDGIENLPNEINKIKNAFQSVLKDLQSEYQQRTDTEKKSALLDQAARVAHDIRSPIAAMEMNLHLLMREVPKEKTQMMQMAIQSVRDITNNLLEQYRGNQKEGDLLSVSSLPLHDDVSISRHILLYSLIDQVVSQKRYEWMQKSCELIFQFDQASKLVWINAVPADLKRMISNLLNNAIEACEQSSRIHVKLTKIENFLELNIIDNGVGIHADKIKSYLNGESSKHAGVGLGLSSAKEYIGSIGGELEINPLPSGTAVNLKFIIDPKPTWYPDRIDLSKNDCVIVLDDDIAMQTLWLHRLQIYPVKIKSFSKYAEVVDWINNNQDHHGRIILLIDYDLSEKSVNGLMLLKDLDVKSRGYLVTSHADEVNIQAEAEKIGIWLIPKALATDIEIGLI